MDSILYWNGNMTDLLTLYGTERYSDIWTYRQAWASGVRQWQAGNHYDASLLFGKLRQELLHIHHDLYPEDSLWRKEAQCLN